MSCCRRQRCLPGVSLHDRFPVIPPPTGSGHTSGTWRGNIQEPSSCPSSGANALRTIPTRICLHSSSIVKASLAARSLLGVPRQSGPSTVSIFRPAVRSPKHALTRFTALEDFLIQTLAIPPDDKSRRESGYSSDEERQARGTTRSSGQITRKKDEDDDSDFDL